LVESFLRAQPALDEEEEEKLQSFNFPNHLVEGM
jgi:hypothetical protein